LNPSRVVQARVGDERDGVDVHGSDKYYLRVYITDLLRIYMGTTYLSPHPLCATKEVTCLAFLASLEGEDPSEFITAPAPGT
jgi:hypothetical protein